MNSHNDIIYAFSCTWHDHRNRSVGNRGWPEYEYVDGTIYDIIILYTVQEVYIILQNVRIIIIVSKKKQD